MLHSEYNNSCIICYTDDFVKCVIDTNTVSLSLDGENIICNKEPWIIRFIYLLCQEYYNINSTLQSYPMNSYSPYVNLFINTANKYRLFEEILQVNSFYLENTAQNKVDIFNRFINNLRIESQNQNFITTVSNYNQPSIKNYTSLLSYIDNLFEKYSKLLVLRIDLTYGKNDFPIRPQDDITQEHIQAKEDREHFFNNMRSNNIFEHKVGYAWKLEFATCKGFHYHMLFFFNGSKVQQDVYTATCIGEYWKTDITQGRGLYFNCNAQKEEYKKLGIGMINWNEYELRRNLQAAAEYLVKPNLYAKLDTSGNKFFGKGIINSENSGRGRPRKLDSAIGDDEL